MTKSDKRDDIIRASLELIAEHGFHGAPMAMIAKKAEVGAGTIYRYFENKDFLINELHRELREKIIAILTEDYSDTKPIRERFIYLGTKLLKYFISYPLHFRFLEQYYNSPYGLSLRRDKVLRKSDNRDIFMDLFEEGITRQVMKDLPLPVQAALAIGPLIALARDHNFGLIELDDELITKSVESCWDGIRRTGTLTNSNNNTEVSHADE